MTQLLTTDTFDSFLLAEATVKTAHFYEIDGHVNKDFYSKEEQETDLPYEFATWSEMRPLLLDLIKGKRTPLYFKFVLHLKPEYVSKTLATEDCSVPAEQIKALILTIKYDGSHTTLTSGTSYHTFLMSKEPEGIWDKALTRFLSQKGINFE